jgi:hypothetical protein
MAMNKAEKSELQNLRYKVRDLERIVSLLKNEVPPTSVYYSPSINGNDKIFIPENEPVHFSLRPSRDNVDREAWIEFRKKNGVVLVMGSDVIAILPSASNCCSITIKE